MDWMWDVRECVKDGFQGFSLSNQMNRGVIYRDGKLQGRVRFGGGMRGEEGLLWDGLSTRTALLDRL